MRIGGLIAALMVVAPGAVAQSVKAPYTVEVVASHWMAVRFEPQYPHGRHTQGALPGASLNLPLAESLMIKGQAGQSSDNKREVAEYRIPVPDVAADAVVDRVIFLGDMQGDVRQMPVLDGVKAAETPCPAEACGAMKLGASVKSFAADIARPLNPAELTIELTATESAPLQLFDATGPAHLSPTVLLHTKGALPEGFRTNEPSGLAMPEIKPLFNQFLRDTSIVLAGDGNYYMTGTTGGPETMVVTSDLSVWKSPDLVKWSPVRDKPRASTVVWNLDRDGSAWLKTITLRDGEPFRPLWAPEIHYLKGTFWIPFSVPRHGITILKSTTGKAEGPYVVAIKPDEPLSTGIDASLFQDDDGTVYSLYGGGWIAKMKPDMSGLAEPYRHIASASGREVGFEGVYMFKDHGVYNLCVADFVLGDYNTYVATASSLAGPWSERYLAVPHAGHANFFRDKNGRMWSTFFGNDRHSPFAAEPGIIPLVRDAKGRWRPDADYVAPVRRAEGLEQLPGAIGPSTGEPQQVGIMPVKGKK